MGPHECVGAQAQCKEQIPAAGLREDAGLTPRAARPIPNVIQASLPMLDGQKMSDGSKSTSAAYRRWFPCGQPIWNARMQKKKPQKLSHANMRKPPSRLGPITA